MRDDEEEYGQVDGDAPPAAVFATSMSSQPWIQQGGMAPWHMWGNTQVLTCPIIAQQVGPLRLNPNQLIKVNYKRPESWHWFFACRMLEGPDSTVGVTRLHVFWDLTIGIGRSMFQTGDANDGFSSARPTFDRYQFDWGPPGGTNFPRNARIWTTQTYAPLRRFDNIGTFSTQVNANNLVAPEPLIQSIDQVVAQDIQLEVRCIAENPTPGALTPGQTLTIEVTAMFAPKVHVRPDWLQLDVPPQAQFAGEEIRGR